MNRHIIYRLYENKNTPNITLINNSIIFDYPCKNNSICEPYYITLYKGVYFIELWGAQAGGSYYNSEYFEPIGRGGYTSGYIIVSTSQSYFLYVGGQGSCGTMNVNIEALGGYNGGGDAYSDYCADGDHDDPAGGGGGASDIRTAYEDYKTKIAVAGGGGGNGALVKVMKLTYRENAYGGGIISGTGYVGNPSSQTEGNIDGIGGKGVCSGRAGGGGGGGYMGGESSKKYNKEGDVGTGGSGYIGGLSSYQYIQPITIPGNAFFYSPYGEFEEGHKGHGSIKITYISGVFQNSCRINTGRSIFIFYALLVIIK